MTIDEVMEHLKASNSDHVRCVLETDETMVLLDYLERAGGELDRSNAERASFGNGPAGPRPEEEITETVELPVKKGGKSK